MKYKHLIYKIQKGQTLFYLYQSEYNIKKTITNSLSMSEVL